jgi:hypothetical protein
MISKRAIFMTLGSGRAGRYRFLLTRQAMLFSLLVSSAPSESVTTIKSKMQTIKTMQDANYQNPCFDSFMRNATSVSPRQGTAKMLCTRVFSPNQSADGL